METPERARELRDAILWAAHKASQSPKDFVDFVGVEEFTGKRLKCADHQDVLIDFVEAHERAVLMLPVGFAKSWSLAMLILYWLGRNPNERIAIVSATLEQAQKPLSFVRDMIENNPRLRLVFPHLKVSRKTSDLWTQSRFTVDRKIVSGHPSLVAWGVEAERIQGSRCSRLIFDDVLNEQNTRTHELRLDYLQKVSKIMGRLDPPKPGFRPKAVIMNTPWHPEDLVQFYAWRQSWPTLRMEATGNVYVHNVDCSEDCQHPCRELDHTNWDHENLRPAFPNSPRTECRLISHDPDPDGNVPLWPEVRGVEWIENAKRGMLPIVFNQQVLCQVRDDAGAFCKREYVEKSLENGRGLTFVESWDPKDGQPFVGVDLAFRKGEQADYTAFFAFAVLPDRSRRVLKVEYGRWAAPEILEKILAYSKAFQSPVVVENNAAQQMMVEFALQANRVLPIVGKTTTSQKWNPTWGVPSLFIEMANGAWRFPSDRYNRVHPMLQRFIDEALAYEPDTHTGDGLMAATMAREQARDWGYGCGGSVSLDASAIVTNLTTR